MTEWAWVPMPSATGWPLTTMGPPPAFLFMWTLPQSEDVLTGVISVSLRVPKSPVMTGLTQLAQSQAKPSPPSVTTRKSFLAPERSAEMSTEWPTVSEVRRWLEYTGLGAAWA